MGLRLRDGIIETAGTAYMTIQITTLTQIKSTSSQISLSVI